MKKKLVIIFLLIILFINVIGFICNNKIFAMQSTQDEYKLELTYRFTKPSRYVLPVGRTVCLNENDGDRLGGVNCYHLRLVKSNENGDNIVIEENINIDNLQVRSSNDKVLTVEIIEGNVYITAISEGVASVILSYSYQGKEYISEIPWTIDEYILDLHYNYIGTLWCVLPVERSECLNANGEVVFDANGEPLRKWVLLFKVM